MMLLAGLFTLMPGAMAYSFSKTFVETFPRGALAGTAGAPLGPRPAGAQ